MSLHVSVDMYLIKGQIYKELQKIMVNEVFMNTFLLLKSR